MGFNADLLGYDINGFYVLMVINVLMGFNAEFMDFNSDS
jgi:hypothetical protein